MIFVLCFLLGFLYGGVAYFRFLNQVYGLLCVQEKKLVAEIKKTAKGGNDVSSFCSIVFIASILTFV